MIRSILRFFPYKNLLSTAVLPRNLLDRTYFLQNRKTSLISIYSLFLSLRKLNFITFVIMSTKSNLWKTLLSLSLVRRRVRMDKVLPTRPMLPTITCKLTWMIPNCFVNRVANQITDIKDAILVLPTITMLPKATCNMTWMILNWIKCFVSRVANQITDIHDAILGKNMNAVFLTRTMLPTITCKILWIMPKLSKFFGNRVANQITNIKDAILVKKIQVLCCQP